MKPKTLLLVAFSCALVLFVSLALAADDKTPNEETQKGATEEETVGINGHGGRWGGGHGGGGWGGGGGYGGGHGGGGWGGGGGGGYCRFGCCGGNGKYCMCCYDAEEARAVQVKN